MLSCFCSLLYMQQDRHQWFKQRLIPSISEPSIGQQSQFKEDTVEPSVPARDFDLKAYAAINLTQLVQPGWALNPGPVGYHSQAARSVMHW